MNSMLAELVKIKTFRRNRAETEVAIQKKNVLAAKTAVEQAEAELARYMIESEQREKALFQEILRQRVKLTKIEEMQHAVSLLRAGVATREERKREAQADLTLHQNNLHQAQNDYQFAVRIEEKFLTLADIEKQNALREAERLSDLELEEVPIAKNEIDEWEDYDE